MKHLILTETEFFRLINDNGTSCDLNTAYGDFVKAVIGLCLENKDTGIAVIILAYTENELQHHRTFYTGAGRSHTDLFVRKALAFVRKMQKCLAMPHNQLPPLSSIPSKDEKQKNMPADAPSMRWTGKASDLVELIYGVSEMGCINDGEVSLKEIADYFYKVLGVQAKGCYNIYSDIKMRKNKSRTYFLDRAAEKVNKRMLLDEERERMRR